MFQPPDQTAVTGGIQTVGQPAWMLYSAFGISVVLFFVKIYEVLAALWARPRLTAKLTKDMFFRHGDDGEMIFLNAILSSSHRAAYITDMTATLVHTDGTQSIPLSLLSLGEPADRGNTTHDHYFFSSSPVDLIPIDKPTRRVLLFTAESHEVQLGATFAELREAARTHGLAAKLTVPNDPDTPPPAEVLAARDALLAAGKVFVDKGMEAIQLKSGKYRVTVEWSYSLGSANSARYSARSSISFVIPPGARERMRAALDRTGAAEVIRVIDPEQKGIPYPTVAPTSITLE